VIEDEEGDEREAEVLLEREPNVEGVSPTEKTKVKISGKGKTDTDTDADEEEQGPGTILRGEIEATIATTTTPPPHAQIDIIRQPYHSPNSPEGEENPWA
jgi:hypothetical protein